MNSIKILDFDVEELRVRLQKMTDEALVCSIRAGEHMCSQWANFGNAPREVFVIQLREAREEETAASR
jgi:hypothetical protein